MDGGNSLLSCGVEEESPIRRWPKALASLHMVGGVSGSRVGWITKCLEPLNESLFSSQGEIAGCVSGRGDHGPDTLLLQLRRFSPKTRR